MKLWKGHKFDKGTKAIKHYDIIDIEKTRQVVPRDIKA